MPANTKPTTAVPEEPCKPHEYALTGPQVEPAGSYWMLCPKLCVPTIEELTELTDDPKNKKDYFPPYPDPCSKEGAAETEREIDELVELSKRRDDPCALVGKAEGKLGERLPISKLLNLTPPALGAVVVNRFPGEQIIRTGRGMARAVESETPGLYHRHALNYLISTRHWSPPRQALFWAALDVAIAGALQAAWYYKWRSPRPLTSRRERPIEYAKRNGIDLDVLFDRPDELNPAYNLCPDGRKPNTMSGTPRHPAYPSGHSTYTGAASEILAFFFGTEQTPAFLVPHPELGSKAPTTIKDELDNLADNIGLGRLWAGIHWRSDHTNGMKLGRTVARLVIQRFADVVTNPDAKPPVMLCPPEPERINQCDMTKMIACNTNNPPDRAMLEADAKKYQANCDKPKDTGRPCPAPPGTEQEKLDANRGVQQGAQ